MGEFSLGWFLVGLAVGWAVPVGIFVAVVCTLKYGDRSPQDRTRLDGP